MARQDKSRGSLLTTWAASGIDVAFLLRAKIIPFKIKGEILSKYSIGTKFDIPGKAFLGSCGR
jgi:hypothetical protein